MIAFNDSITTMKTSFMTTITDHNDHDTHKAVIIMVIKTIIYSDWQEGGGFHVMIFPLKVFSKPKNIS